MDNTDPHCEYITVQEVKDKEFNTDKNSCMKTISKHKIANAIEYMPLANDVRGIHGIVQPGGFNTVHNIVGMGNQNKEHIDHLDKLHLAAVNGIKKQSENDIL